MPILITKEEGNVIQELPSEDNHVAVCIGVWALGKKRTEYKGEVSIKEKILIRWEIDEEMKSGEYAGLKKCINKYYNMSIHKDSNLTQDIESWMGSIDQYLNDSEPPAMDLEILIGKACMLNIKHNEANGKTYANVMNVSKLAKGLNPFEPDNLHTPETPDPEWVEKIRANFFNTLDENQT